MRWFYADEAEQQHEFGEEDFPSLIESAKITHDTLVWNETLPEWLKCSQARPGLFQGIAKPPALTPTQQKHIRLTSVEAQNGPPPLDGVALCSMIFGILGILSCVYLISIPAVICGHIGLKRANMNPGNSSNKGFSITGLITGYIGISLLLLFIVYFVVILVVGASTGFDSLNSESFDDL